MQINQRAAKKSKIMHGKNMPLVPLGVGGSDVFPSSTLALSSFTRADRAICQAESPPSGLGTGTGIPTESILTAGQRVPQER